MFKVEAATMVAVGAFAAVEAVAPNVIDPSSGWTITTILAAVLGWMFMKHLPDERKSRDDAQTKLLETLNNKDAAHSVTVQSVTREFRDALKVVVDHCDKEMNAALDRAYGGQSRDEHDRERG